MSKQTPKEPLSTFDTGAVRSSDASYVRYDLVSPIALKRLAEAYKEGAVKYGDYNWRKGFPWSDVLNHLELHIAKFKLGDTSEDHLSHAAWGLFTLMDFETTHPELDDRWDFSAHVNSVKEPGKTE